jgi:alkylated DNA repair dioxygenase AlkB
MKLVLESDGLVEYYSGFISASKSHDYLLSLLSELDWQHDELVMFGKRIITKRKVAWYADKPYTYTYSKNAKVAKPWTKTLINIKHQLEQYTGEHFNSCLLNYYHNGEEGMGWHSDNEKMMRKQATIASVSFGAQRDFKFQHNVSHQQHVISLETGSVLLMKDQTQDYWKHQLPIRKRVTKPRINLTFRDFINT